MRTHTHIDIKKKKQLISNPCFLRNRKWFPAFSSWFVLHAHQRTWDHQTLCISALVHREASQHRVLIKDVTFLSELHLFRSYGTTISTHTVYGLWFCSLPHVVAVVECEMTLAWIKSNGINRRHTRYSSAFRVKIRGSLQGLFMISLCVAGGTPSWACRPEVRQKVQGGKQINRTWR